LIRIFQGQDDRTSHTDPHFVAGNGQGRPKQGYLGEVAGVGKPAQEIELRVGTDIQNAD
jgi:hypothetical protein